MYTTGTVQFQVLMLVHIHVDEYGYGALSWGIPPPPPELIYGYSCTMQKVDAALKWAIVAIFEGKGRACM